MQILAAYQHLADNINQQHHDYFSTFERDLLRHWSTGIVFPLKVYYSLYALEILSSVKKCLSTLESCHP